MTWRALFRLLVLVALVFVFVTQVAAIGPATSATANAIVAVVMLLLPFIGFNRLPFKGAQMVIASYVVAVVITAAAAFLSHDLLLSDFANPGSILGLAAQAGAFWAISQGVYGLLKDNPTLGPLLK